MKLTVEHSVATAVHPSPRVLRTASMFGLGVDERQRLTIVPRAEIEVPDRGIVLLTGPSGGGKSTVLRLIVHELRQRGRMLIDLNDLPALPDAPLVDAFDLPLEKTASLLAMAGLGDAFLMLRTPHELSDGQRARLRLAHAMQLAGQSRCGAVVVCDEFTATLDRLTARIIARNLRRWIDRGPRDRTLTFIAATTHEDLIEALAPDLLIYKGLADEMEIAAPPPAAPMETGLRIETGQPSDYESLAKFHYRSAAPRIITSALRMVHERSGVSGGSFSRRSAKSIVGVLLRSPPHLCCSLRDYATHGRYHGLPRRETALILNREVRTVSRVVVHPQWRGMGLAVDLVRHALAHPEPGQVYTEALAAMGHVHPFFERAGMVRYDRPPRAEHARLLDALARLDIEPHLLASPRVFLGRLQRHDEMMQVWFEHELACWVKSGAPRTKRADRRSLDFETMLLLARDQLLALPVYYLYRHLPEENDAADST